MAESPPPTPEQVEARLALLYQETNDVVAAFWDWRHKVILICSTALVLTFAIVSWMYKNRLGGVAMALALLAGAGVAWMCRGMDRRNGQIMAGCYSVAMQLEEKLRDTQRGLGYQLPLGVFAAIEASRESEVPYEPKTRTYGWILRRAYTVLGLMLLALAVAAVGLEIFSPGTLRLEPPQPPTPTPTH